MRDSKDLKRVQLSVQGVVQGVGFRPFVYKKASLLELAGFVYNDSQGVIIEVEGKTEQVEQFCQQLPYDAPPFSHIDSINIQEITLKYDTVFEIRESLHGGFASTMLPKDLSLCEACKKEMKDSKNRRYGYPFINCTNCGPRYTIIKTLPYDRKNTSMHDFSMCKQCQKEYDDPTNRRYHAEPISCFECGPKLYLLDKDGKKTAENKQALTLTCKLIREGKIVAIKGVGGFHIVCDATNSEAVKLLRERKKRAFKPLAVMFSSLEMIKEHAYFTPKEQEYLLCKERPIVVVEQKENSTLSHFVAPNIKRVGVFLPYTPLHELLLEELKIPLIATSANLKDEPIIINEDELIRKLGDIIDAVLSHDRAIINGCDDSVLQCTDERVLMLRNARGYAPLSLKSKGEKQKKILALGGDQKNTLALGFGSHMILSPYIGDLHSLNSFDYFKRTLKSFEYFYDFKPDIIVCDKHPKYHTTQWAKEQGVKLLQIQHHYAHALACMAEYALDEKVLAFCFDGTGYGDDKTIWGGEVLIADTKKYDRVFHLKTYKLLGAEKAIKEPKRIALSLLFQCYSLEEVLMLENPVVKLFSTQEIKNLHVMWQKGLNSPETSSLGRIFDAVASFAEIVHELDFEGQSGLWLESLVDKIDKNETFSFTLKNGIINIDEMILEIIACKDKKQLASKFISTVANIVIEITKIYADLPIVLSGGVFQNKILTTFLIQNLKNSKLYVQSKTPVNDASIALGQLYYAAML
jgi:hydrogenase maturation protein HypF